MAALITGAFAAALEANRDACNQRIAEVVRTVPSFDARALSADLRDVVAPIVDVVDRAGHGFTTQVAMTLFGITVDLHATGRFEPVIAEGWTRVLPVLAGPLAADPPGVVGPLTNALAYLSAHPGARAQDWIDRVVAVIATGAAIDVVWRAGQVAAWRCGVAEHRDGALAIAATLDPAVLDAVLGASPADLVRLAADPWFDPADASASASRPASLLVGGFRGFGGPFVRPPVVTLEGARVVADDGDERWYVLADAFGSAVVRAGAESGRAAPARSDPGVASGTGAATTIPAALAGVTEITSWVAVPGALVATSALSHAIAFVKVTP